MKQVKLTRRAGGRKEGDVIDVTDGVAEQLIESGSAEAVESASGKDEDTSPYAKLTGEKLKAEIDKRNADRDDEAKHIKPEGTKVADLRAALEADDESSAE
ncbi:hypothetical protein [Agrococcus sp. Marseille-Q4369]|uniref:hypothetical protein n=1 Tax=Agrococcus sp. Marseille-Q4369 TaxID=2810513 RepID=UPI001B8ACF4A|nr:hypothetical protein [Agrococcus sp. Marseille-Q4369]QUW18882.1 hypothetical protein JSQ78_00405 [Agrococcus sp. Marseille-Q4369]